jgi:pimeloyl-ACP methyl ester carboxylesterase
LIRVILRLLLVLVLVAVTLALTVWHSPLWVAAKFTQARLHRVGIHSYSLILDGQELHYIEGGTGEPVVLVHGLGGSAQQDWAELIPYLLGSGRHVYAMDLLGFGESAKPPDRNYSIMEQARLVETFLDSKRLDRVALAGGSMGGWIAATVALDQPQRVRQLVLFDSAGLSFHVGFDPALFRPQTLAQVDGLMAVLMPHPQPMPDFVKRDLIRNVKRDGWIVERALASMRTGADLLDQRFVALKMPMLLVWGKQDVLTPLTVGEAMHHAAPQSVLEVYDGCGHIAAQMCADRIAPRMAGFLAGIGPQPGATVEVPAN